MTRIRRSLNGVALVGFAISIWACSGSTAPVGPSAPIVPVAPSVRNPFYTLSGVISEVTPAGLLPVEGATVEAFACDAAYSNCGHYIDLSATSGSDGSYEIPGLWAGQETGLWVIKDGYVVDGPPPAKSCDGCSRLFTVSVDTQVDLQLVRR